MAFEFNVVGRLFSLPVFTHIFVHMFEVTAPEVWVYSTYICTNICVGSDSVKFAVVIIISFFSPALSPHNQLAKLRQFKNACLDQVSKRFFSAVTKCLRSQFLPTK